MSFYFRYFLGAILVLSSIVSSVALASAESVERNIILTADEIESFTDLLEQAQDLARETIEQEFAENSDVNQVTLLILGEHEGQTVPILRSEVSRYQWQQDSRLYRWTRYFVRSSKVLLGFRESTPSPSTPRLQISRPQRRNLENDPGYRDD